MFSGARARDSTGSLNLFETFARLFLLQKVMLTETGGVEHLQHVVLYQPRRAKIW